MSKHNPEQHKKNLLIALEKHLGIVTTACKEVGLSRDTFYHYYNNDPEFKEKVDLVNEYTLDFTETQLLKKIKEGSERSILFYMRYKGKKRGYTDSIDLTTDGEKLNNQIKIVFVDGNKSDTSPEKDA
jgi:hypothetical protein